MFHSHLQNSLVNWGRANKIHYHNLVILQNKILRASLFLPMHHPTNLLYTKFDVLKLDDMIKMELAKFMFKFNNKTFPNSFNNYFLRLDKLHKYNTRQTKRNEYFQSFVSSEAGRRGFVIDIPQDLRHCSFYKFKIFFKTNILKMYGNTEE